MLHTCGNKKLTKLCTGIPLHKFKSFEYTVLYKYSHCLYMLTVISQSETKSITDLQHHHTLSFLPIISLTQMDSQQLHSTVI